MTKLIVGRQNGQPYAVRYFVGNSALYVCPFNIEPNELSNALALICDAETIRPGMLDVFSITPLEEDKHTTNKLLLSGTWITGVQSAIIELPEGALALLKHPFDLTGFVYEAESLGHQAILVGQGQEIYILVGSQAELSFKAAIMHALPFDPEEFLVYLVHFANGQLEAGHLSIIDTSILYHKVDLALAASQTTAELLIELSALLKP